MRSENYWKLQFLFLFSSFYGFSAKNVNTTGVEESVLKAMFNGLDSVINLSKNFQRFPMNDSYFEMQYFSKSNSTSLPVHFNQRLISLLEFYRVSGNCRTDILDLNSGLEHHEDWALRMVDAFGKPVSGLVDLGLNWLGSYDECVRAPFHLDWIREHSFFSASDSNNTVDGKYRVLAQYCTATLPLPLSLVPHSSSYLVHELVPPKVQVGVCFPDTCSETDISRIIKAVADHVQGSDSELLVDVECATETSLSAGAIVLLVILCLLGVMVIIGTAYDILLIRMKLFSNADNINVFQDESLQLTQTVSNGTTSEVNGTLRKNSAQNESSDKQEVEKTYSATDESRRQEPDGNLHILLMSFSIIKNGQTVLTPNTSGSRVTPNTSGTRVDAIEGVRTLTTGWIILMHTFMFSSCGSDNHGMYMAENRSDWTFQPVMAPFNVDTFFVISGCLVTYLNLMRLDKDGGMRNFAWGRFYFLRFWRLSPTYYLVFFIYWLLLPLLSSGPLVRSESHSQAYECPNLWWSNLLYFNNFYGPRIYGCYGISWYLAADMQCYILSPIIFGLFYWKPKIGIIVSMVTMAASCLYIGVVTKMIEMDSTVFAMPITEAQIGYVGLIHMYPFSHIAPYVVGMVTGYLLYKHRTTPIINITTRWQILCWCVSMIFILSAVYLPAFGSADPANMSSFKFMTVLYMTPSKLIWALGVGWIIYSCATGNGGFVNSLLSWKPFVVLGRLTFTTYLVHTSVLHMMCWPRRTLCHLSDMELAYSTTAAIVLSFGVGFIVSVCVEQPSFGLQKLLFKDKRRS